MLCFFLAVVRGGFAHAPKRVLLESRFLYVGIGRLFQGNVDVFEKFPGSNAEETIEDLDQVIAGLAGLLAAESVGESQGVGKLTSADDKTRAIDIPITFQVHDRFTLWG